MFGERFPLLRWFPVSWAFLRADIVAGITVAFVAVPQWMAYAGLAGLSPIHGLWCCVLPMALGAIFGWCHQLNTGPVAMSSLLTASVLAPLAVPFTDAWAGLALTLAFLVGLIRIALGLLQAGQLTALISHPVLAGFTTAAALIICLSQVPLLLGLTPLQGTWFLGDVVRSLTTIQSPAWARVTMGLGCLGACWPCVDGRPVGQEFCW